MGFPGGSVVKNPSASGAGDMGSNPGSERSPVGRNGNPLQYGEMATNPWTEEPGGLQSMGSHRVDTTEQFSMHTCT